MVCKCYISDEARKNTNFLNRIDKGNDRHTRTQRAESNKIEEGNITRK